MESWWSNTTWEFRNIATGPHIHQTFLLVEWGPFRNVPTSLPICLISIVISMRPTTPSLLLAEPVFSWHLGRKGTHKLVFLSIPSRFRTHETVLRSCRSRLVMPTMFDSKSWYIFQLILKFCTFSLIWSLFSFSFSPP